MKSKTKARTSRFIFILALVSFLIATVQGVLFYKKYDAFFKFLLVMQNSINAFGFKASVSIKDVIAFMNNEPSLINTVVGYAYCIAVFTAPYCTISFVYKFLERILRLIIGFRRGKNCQHIIIFGYNDDVKAMLHNNKSDPKEICIHVITTEKIGQEEVYDLNKSGYVIHNIDVLKASAEELPALFSNTHLEEAKYVILFEESSIRNFSLLQTFRLCEKDSADKIRLCEGAKVSCRCEEEGIGRLIAEYYNSAAGKDAFYDLELVNFPEMQIHKMYSDVPLHKIYEKTENPLDECTVHLLVAGLGQLGQQAVLQAMNLGILSDKNKIIIDVFDTDIKRQKAEFINQFSSETFDISDNRISLKSAAADGILEINFYALNVKYLDFYSLLKEKTTAVPYTYAVITLENIDFAVNCAMQLEEIFSESGHEIPILMRMDSDRRLAGFISSENTAMANVQIIDDRSCIITLEMIINREIDKIAKEYNHLYNNISIISSDEEGNSDNSDIDPETEWNRLRLFRRSSSKAAAYHDEVKEFIIPRLAKEKGTDLEKKLDEILGSDGSIMKYTGSAWRMNGSEQEVLETLKNDSFAYALASLEHRRWCSYMASIGWRAGEKSDRFRRNPCLVTQQKLMETQPEMCKYDLMSLMERYKRIAIS